MEPNYSQQNPQYQQTGLPQGYTTPPVQRVYGTGATYSLVKELSPKEPLQDVMENLRGKLWDSKLQTYVEIQGATPLMNDEGRDVFFHFATSMISQINTMSNWTNDYKRIHKIVMMIVRDASIHFHLNWRDYKISRKTKITLITSKLRTLGLSAMYHALGAGDRKASTSNISENISTLSRPDSMSQEQQKRKGFLARMVSR